MTKFKKIFPVIFLAVFLFLILAGFSFAAKELELDYPEVPGAETPTTIKTFLPEYIKYLFNLAIVIAGIVAFFSLVYGGFRYLASAGSPVAMADARAQITAGILGLAIILGSWLLLTTINPQLTVLQITPEELNKGVILYAGACEGDTPSGEEGVNFLRVRRSLSDLEDFTNKTQNIYFYDSGDEMEVYIFPREGWQPEDDPSWQSKDHGPGECRAVSGGSRSIKLYWKIPGIYLYENENCETPPEPRLFVGNSADFGGGFHDKVRSIRIMPSHKTISKPDGTEGTYVREKYGAILFEQSNYHGDATVWVGGDDPTELFPPCINLDQPCNTILEPYCKENVNQPGNPRASAIIVYRQQIDILPPETMGEGVTIFGNYDWNEEAPGDRKEEEQKHCGPINAVTDVMLGGRLGTGIPLWLNGDHVDIGEPILYPGTGNDSELDCEYLLKNHKVSSIKVEGNYIAVLFREDGRGQVFNRPGDFRLKDDHIGDDQARYILVIPIARE